LVEAGRGLTVTAAATVGILAHAFGAISNLSALGVIAARE